MSGEQLDARLVSYVIICGFSAVFAFLAWQLLQRVVIRQLSPVPVQMRQPLLMKLLLGLVIGLIALWLMIWPAWFSGAFNEGAVDYQPFSPTGAERISFAVLLRFFFFQGLAEELIYRGIALCLMATGIFSAAGRFLRPDNAGPQWMHYNWLLSGFAANLLISATFAIWHGSNPGITGLAMLNIGLAGLVLGQLFLNQASLSGAAVLHIIWNLSMAVLGLPVSGIIVSRPLFGGIQGAGMELISGGRFGPEGSLSCSAALLLVLAYLLWTALPSSPKQPEPDPAADPAVALENRLEDQAG